MTENAITQTHTLSTSLPSETLSGKNHSIIRKALLRNNRDTRPCIPEPKKAVFMNQNENK
jgi:hypothetical protein